MPTGWQPGQLFHQLPVELLLSLVGKLAAEHMASIVLSGWLPWVMRKVCAALHLSSFLRGGRFPSEERLGRGGRYVFLPARNINYPDMVVKQMAERIVPPPPCGMDPSP